MNKFRNLRQISLFAVLLILLAFGITASGCSLLKKDKQSVALKKQEDAKKKAVADYDKAIKQYYKHQNEETKEMMKNTKKKSDAYNKPKKNKWLFKPKCK
jgi:iron uptake system EfeUOB component EfeO/EfeM